MGISLPACSPLRRRPRQRSSPSSPQAPNFSTRSAYLLSLTDGALDAAHLILGYEDYEPFYGADPHGRRLALMMRLTDHLDPEGHAFDSILESVMAAEPTEDPRPDRAGGPW